jgi:photosystem II stability/assembly factor-like uncharacterized protein
VAPSGLGSLETIRAFSEDDAVAVADHGLIATSDGGLHWNSIAPPDLPRDATYRAFFLDRRHGWLEARATSDFDHFTVFRTIDGGRTWESAEVPVPRTFVRVERSAPDRNVPFPIGFSDREHGWIAPLNVSPAPFLFTRDGGATWRRGAVLDQSRDTFVSLTFTSESEGWAIRDHEIAIRHGDREIDYLAHTSDGGATWTRVELGPPPIPVENPDVPSSQSLGVPRFFGPSDAVMPAWTYDSSRSALYTYVTHDGGRTWSATPAIPLDQGLGSPIFEPSFVSSTTWFMWSTSGRLASTVDAGKHWTVFRPDIPGEPSVLALEFTSASDGWACYGDSWSGPVTCTDPLYRTGDGGLNWTVILSNR